MSGTQQILPMASMTRAVHDNGFTVTDGNGSRVRAIERAVQARGAGSVPVPGLVITGPAGSGKTSLLRRLAREHGARPPFIATTELADPGAAREERLFIDVNDASEEAQKALLHFLNAAFSSGAFAVLACHPSYLQQVTLPDLSSRLRAYMTLDLPDPDIDMLRFLLGKAFAEKQLEVNPAVLDYCSARLPRDYLAPQRCADILDRAALAQNRAVTVALAATCPEAFSPDTRDAPAAARAEEPAPA